MIPVRGWFKWQKRGSDLCGLELGIKKLFFLCMSSTHCAAASRGILRKLQIIVKKILMKEYQSLISNKSLCGSQFSPVMMKE